MSKPKRYRVESTDGERRRLVALTTTGAAPARAIRRARVLLLAADDRLDAEVAAAVGCGAATVGRVRRRCAEEGVEAARRDRTRPGAAPLLDGKAEALLVALACSDGPAGRGTWTMPRLADRLVALGAVGRISDETVRRALTKTGSSPGSAGSGASVR